LAELDSFDFFYKEIGEKQIKTQIIYYMCWFHNIHPLMIDFHGRADYIDAVLDVKEERCALYYA